MKVRAVVFDPYGTLFDVQSVVAGDSNFAGDLRGLSVLWGQRQGASARRAIGWRIEAELHDQLKFASRRRTVVHQ